MSLNELTQQIEEHIRSVDAEFGVYVRHLGSDDVTSFNGDELYLLASVFKVPILLEALRQVDARQLHLDQRVELRHADQLPTSMIFQHLQSGLNPTVRDLLTAMIIVSDNTATDMVLRLVGIENIQHSLQSWGITDIAVRMSVEDLFTEGFRWPDAVESMPVIYREVTENGPLVDPETGLMAERFKLGLMRGPNWSSIAAQRTLENNVATPRAMGELLERLVNGELLSHNSTLLALDIMLRQQLNQRLPRFLPPTVVMAHKTGTFFSARNDAGILYLPNGSKAVVVVFAVVNRDLAAQDPLRSGPYIDSVDATMARITRSIYDFFR